MMEDNIMKLISLFTTLLLTFPIISNSSEFILTDAKTGVDVGDWTMNNMKLGIQSKVDFSIEKKRLYGGKQAGVDIVIVRNGEMEITLVPTRGMGIFNVKQKDQRILGWDSPVKEIVNPIFIDLESRNGVGWLDGFNEMLVRCGYEWTGHPGIDDNGQLLSLHGRVQNTPASNVKIVIEDNPPYAISVIGEVSELTFKKSNLVTTTKFSIIPGSQSFSVHDTLTNKSDYDDEYQVIYHSNFGSPILEKGAKFTAAVSEISPFNNYAKAGLKNWGTYLGPTKNFDEMVFNFKPIGDENGNTLAVLHNSLENKGVSVAYNIKQLPVLTLWKNTDTLNQGYVTGIEPGTSYAYSTKYQRPLGLVPKIKAGQSKQFDVTYTVLNSSFEVKSALGKVLEIQGNQVIKLIEQPIVDLTNISE